MSQPTALLSVSDKQGIVEFARALAASGVRLLSTGGTARLLADAGLAVTEVAEVTGSPEMLDGRVKTLHPRIHGGLLARRDRPEHMAALAEHGIDTIDLLIVNLYPFAQATARPDCTLEDAIENIDIGGPAMLRAAAKNWADVAVVIDPADYPRVLEELRAGGVQRQHALHAGQEGVRTHRRLRRHDQQLPRRAAARRRGRRGRRAGARALPGRLHAAADQDAGHALRREPAPERGLLPRRGTRAGPARRLDAGAGQGAVVQQHRRCRRGVGVRQDLRRPRLRDRQARQPLRRGRGAPAWRRPTPRPGRPTRPRPMAASSPATGRWTKPPRGPSATTSSSSRC